MPSPWLKPSALIAVATISLLAASTASADPESTSPLYARIGTTEISIADIEREMERFDPEVRRQWDGDEKTVAFAEEMLIFELLAREAETRGYGDDPEVKRDFQTAVVETYLARNFAAAAASEISNAEVETYFHEHERDFSRPEMRRASHIQVADLAKANELLPQAQTADVRRFAELANQNSVDAETNARGGDLRYFDRQGRSANSEDPVLDPALAEAAFALRSVGDVSTSPVAVGTRFSILKLTGLREGESQSVERASEVIRSRILERRRAEAIENRIRELRAQVGNVRADWTSNITFPNAERLTPNAAAGEEAISQRRAASPTP